MDEDIRRNLWRKIHAYTFTLRDESDNTVIIFTDEDHADKWRLVIPNSYVHTEIPLISASSSSRNDSKFPRRLVQQMTDYLDLHLKRSPRDTTTKFLMFDTAVPPDRVEIHIIFFKTHVLSPTPSESDVLSWRATLQLPQLRLLLPSGVVEEEAAGILYPAHPSISKIKFQFSSFESSSTSTQPLSSIHTQSSNVSSQTLSSVEHSESSSTNSPQSVSSSGSHYIQQGSSTAVDGTRITENLPVAEFRGRTPIAEKVTEESGECLPCNPDEIIITVESTSSSTITYYPSSSSQLETDTTDDDTSIGENLPLDVVPVVVPSQIPLPEESNVEDCEGRPSSTEEFPDLLLTPPEQFR